MSPPAAESLLAAAGSSPWEEREPHDPSGGKASYWLQRAAAMLDCAVQCCGLAETQEIIDMEERCDVLAKQLKEKGR